MNYIEPYFMIPLIDPDTDTSRQCLTLRLFNTGTDSHANLRQCPSQYYFIPSWHHAATFLQDKRFALLLSPMLSVL